MANKSGRVLGGGGINFDKLFDARNSKFRIQNLWGVGPPIESWDDGAPKKRGLCSQNRVSRSVPNGGASQRIAAWLADATQMRRADSESRESE